VVRLSAPIVTNQCEYHPYLNHALLIDECRRLGISVIAYWGEAVGRVFTDPVLKEMVRTRGRSVARCAIAAQGPESTLDLRGVVGAERRDTATAGADQGGKPAADVDVQTERLRRTGDRDHDHVVQPARLDADRGHAESLRQRVEIVLLEIREAVLPQQPPR
jgi:hypothetical protein